MAQKKVLVVFGSTGNQGGSVVDVITSNVELNTKYAIRGITRDPSSSKSQALAKKGVELRQADVNDPESVLAAVRGAYGVFAMTDYWSLLDKEKEIAQGKAIVDACKSAGVTHLVWSSLPPVSKLSHGKYTGVAHFDSKAQVADYAEATKGDMLVSYFMPAMFMEVVKQITQKDDHGNFSLALPFPDPNVPWPLLTPRRDTGKFVLGLFEGGAKANGVHVQGTSAWVTPKDAVRTLGEGTGKKATFQPIDVATYESYLPENVRRDMSEMMQWIGESSYYGQGSKELQSASDKWLVNGSHLTSWADFVRLEFGDNK